MRLCPQAWPIPDISQWLLDNDAVAVCELNTPCVTTDRFLHHSLTFERIVFSIK